MGKETDQEQVSKGTAKVRDHGLVVAPNYTVIRFSLKVPVVKLKEQRLCGELRV